jgi:SulP family sulfate permease
LRQDLAAGLALAAVALPSQLGTAHLAGFPPAAGLVAFAAGSVGFAAFGANRFVVACADSTIAPIFVGGIATLVATGSHNYFALCTSFALIAAGILVCCGSFRLGWIADLVSRPPEGSLLQGVFTIAGKLGESNPVSLLLGLAVFEVTVLANGSTRAFQARSWASWRRLSRSIGLGLSAMASRLWDNYQANFRVSASPRSYSRTSFKQRRSPSSSRPSSWFKPPQRRSFVAVPGAAASINRDFIGVGAANLMEGLFGTFPVNASPPLTETVAETGGRTKLTGLTAAALIVALADLGSTLLAHIPLAAVAGILIFVAMRIVRLGEIVTISRHAFGEFVLILATVTAIIVLPVGTGVATGSVLSLLHGLWSTTRARLITFEGFRKPRFGGRRAAISRARRSKGAGRRFPSAAFLPERL